MTYISDINPATPSGQDLVLNGDNEIRAFKTDVANTIGGLDAPVYEDADTNGAGGSTLVSAATMSSWEARISAIEAVATNPEGTSIPVGGMITWYGDLNTIPSGFKQCDGTSYQYTLPGGGTATVQTPDLRGRFIVGPGASNGPTYDFSLDPYWDVGAFGPQLTGETVTSGNHNHTTATPGHALTTAEMPTHGHALFSNNEGSGLDRVSGFQATAVAMSNTGDDNYDMRQGTLAPQVGYSGEAGSGASHTHPAGTTAQAGVHTHQLSITPPYRGLYTIMYVADGVPV